MERYWQWTCIALLAASATLVVVLSRQNNELQRAYHAVRDAQIVPTLGSWIPQFALPSLHGGDEALFGADAGGHLIFIFDPFCPASRQAAPSFRELASVARSSGLKASGLSRAKVIDVQNFLNDHTLSIPVYQSGAREHSYLGVRVIPTVLLLDKAGRVKYAHVGAINHQTFEGIKAAVRSDRRNGATLM